MRSIVQMMTIGLAALAIAGCQNDRVPPPNPARVPDPNERRIAGEYDHTKPLPSPSRDDLPPPPFDDVPIVSQQAPEVSRFVDAYTQVGRPRLVVWVAQTGGGSYEDGIARDIDYAAIESILDDWLSAGGRVAVVSPEAARQALTPQQAKELNTGHPTTESDIGERLRADVLILVRAQLTHQGEGGSTALRLVADASNIRGGESLGQVVVDVPPPLDKAQLSKYTRFVARKLMSDMTGAWTGFGGAPPPANMPRTNTPPMNTPTPSAPAPSVPRVPPQQPLQEAPFEPLPPAQVRPAVPPATQPARPFNDNDL